MTLERLCNRYCANWPECACGQSGDDDQPHACVTHDPTAVDIIMDFAALCGRLASIVEWCVENDGKCLADNPKQLAFARRALNMARDRLPKS